MRGSETAEYTYLDYLKATQGPEDEKCVNAVFDNAEMRDCLIRRAKNTTPSIFLDEIRAMLSMHANGPKTEEEREKIKFLEGKYFWSGNETGYGIVREQSVEPDIRIKIMYMMLKYVFPQFFLVNEDVARPSSWFWYPEFGGLIPKTHRLMTQKVRRLLIVIHITTLMRHKIYSIRQVHALIGRQILTGILSDEARLRFLQEHNLLDHYGDLSEYLKDILRITTVPPIDENLVLWHFFEETDIKADSSINKRTHSVRDSTRTHSLCESTLIESWDKLQTSVGTRSRSDSESTLSEKWDKLEI